MVHLWLQVSGSVSSHPFPLIVGGGGEPSGPFFSVCLSVLLPFLELALEPAILSPDREVVFYLYCILLCIVITYMFFIVYSPPSLWVCQRYSFIGTYDMTRDWVSCWTVHLSLFVLHLSLAGLVP